MFEEFFTAACLVPKVTAFIVMVVGLFAAGDYVAEAEPEVGNTAMGIALLVGFAAFAVGFYIVFFYNVHCF